MSDVVLAILSSAETTDAVLHGALRLAQLLSGARINVLAMHRSAPHNPLIAAALIAETADELVPWADDQVLMASLKSRFDAWLDDVRLSGVAAHWIDVEGAPAAAIEERSRRADFLVIAQPRPDDDSATRHGLQAALLHTERPVLVMPARWHEAFGGCVAIAWRDDPCAVKAVLPALRMVGEAAHVHLLAGVRGGARPPLPPLFLEDHGVRATMHVLSIGDQPFGKTLLDGAHALGADMMVMGAYVHSPLREMLLGGVTRYLLHHADLPLLMRH